MLHYARRLPHWQPDNVPIFITWNLHGAVPHNRFPPPKSESAGKTFVLRDRYLDAAKYGPRWLEKPEIAKIVVDALTFGEQKLRNYDLHAWVVMPNHVHILITPNVPVPSLMRALKGVTAREANKLLERTGEAFWQHESYDHWVRDQRQFNQIAQYIEDNPARAGLCLSPSEYPWSHAGTTASMAS